MPLLKFFKASHFRKIKSKVLIIDHKSLHDLFKLLHPSQFSPAYSDCASPTGTWRAQSVECVTLDLGVVSWSPTLGVETTLKKSLKFFLMFIYFWEREWERERESMSRGRAERDWDTESKAGFRFWAVSTEPNVGLEPMRRVVRSWPELKSDTQPTEPPRRSYLKKSLKLLTLYNHLHDHSFLSFFLFFF